MSSPFPIAGAMLVAKVVSVSCSVEHRLLHRFWPLGLLVLAIFISSSTVVTPKQFIAAVVAYSPFPVTERGFRQFWFDGWWLFVKGWHATEFGIVYLALRHAMGAKRFKGAALIASLVAASDEIHQRWVPARGGHASDWLIDLVGIAMAIAFFDLRTLTPAWHAGARFAFRAVLAILAVILVRRLALYPF